MVCLIGSVSGLRSREPAHLGEGDVTVMSLLEDISVLQDRTLEAIAQVKNSGELEAIRIDVLGKKGTLTAALRGMAEVSQDMKAEVGKALNSTRTLLETALKERAHTLAAVELTARMDADAIDITLPGRARPIGTQHLINRIASEISEIFAGIGYTVVDGPEVETDYYNFTALNAPADHPSRSMQDTFYVVDRSGDVAGVRGESDVLLRTQTSGEQIHVMEQQRPPIYIIAPGKVYRRDVADPSHLPQFTQI